MGKVSGSYASVVLGVSEQVPQDRRPGQHYEQVNMISDPVRGLARRHGSVMQDEKRLGFYLEPTYEAMVNDTANHKEFTFFVAGVEYALLYRSSASVSALSLDLSFAFAFNKDERKIIPIVTDGSSMVSALKSGGVSAAVNVGKYVYLAGNSITPTWTPTQAFDNPTNASRMVVWVRGGAFSRTFSVTLHKPDGTTLTASYKTKPSSYPDLLDTSDILTADPDYQKKVNDRTNAYNSAVTAYIGEAAEDITPENIAAKLKDALTTAGVTGLGLIGSTITIDTSVYTEVSAEDGGDNSLIRAVGNRVSNVELVSTVHYVGKVVKVRPKKTAEDDALYLVAVPKEEGTTGWGEVTWRETAGYIINPSEVFVQGTVVSETLYLAANAAGLATIAGGTHPEYKANTVGDDVSSPVPYFFGKRIDYMGMFQDRLVIGSGATLLFSRPGDYFNWFRTSVLVQDERDPIEMYALGAEDDTIKTSTTYDRNLLLFGKRKQYTVNGRSKLIAQTASIVVLSAYEDAVDAEPQNSGNFVFYGKHRNGVSSVHQIQMGQLADSPESFNVSQQLDRYLAGKPVQIVALTSPNHVLLRTTASRNTIYTYAYLDTPAGTERLFDAWSKWTWNEALGVCIGLSRHEGDILSFTLREGLDRDGIRSVFLACDRFVLDTKLSEYPYLDSLRPISQATTPSANAFINTTATALDDVAAVAFDGNHEYRFLGTPFGSLSDFFDQYPIEEASNMYVGLNYSSLVTPTNPYVLDRSGKALVNGRLTLGRVGVSLADTGGFTCTVATANGSVKTQDFNGRILGRSSNPIGRQPIVTTSVSCTIGKEVRECSYTLEAKRWLPLTVTAIEWTGQHFNNQRRV